MPPGMRRAFQTVFPTVVPHLGGTLLVMVLLLYPGLPWWMTLVLALVLVGLLCYLLGRVWTEYQEDQDASDHRADEFVPLEPLDPQERVSLAQDTGRRSRR